MLDFRAHDTQWGTDTERRRELPLAPDRGAAVGAPPRDRETRPRLASMGAGR